MPPGIRAGREHSSQARERDNHHSCRVWPLRHLEWWAEIYALQKRHPGHHKESKGCPEGAWQAEMSYSTDTGKENESSPMPRS